MLRFLKEKNLDSNDFKISSHFKHGFFAGMSLIFVASFFDKIFILNMIYVSINKFFESLFVAIFIGELLNILNLFIGKSIPHYINKEILDWIGITIFFIFGIELLTNGITMKNKKYIKHYKENRKKYLKNDKNNITSNKNTEIKNDEETQALNNNNEIYNDNKNYNIIEENIIDLDNSENIYVDISEKDRYNKSIGIFDSWWKYCLLYLLNFLGEKAQIATILLVNKYDFKGFFCGTSCAVLLNSLISMLLGKSIANILTNKQISILTGIIFLCFSAIFLVEKFSYHN